MFGQGFHFGLSATFVAIEVYVFRDWFTFDRGGPDGGYGSFVLVVVYLPSDFDWDGLSRWGVAESDSLVGEMGLCQFADSVVLGHAQEVFSGGMDGDAQDQFCSFS